MTGSANLRRGAPAKTVIPIEIVITGLDPVIQLLRKTFSRRLMDARIKSGHDEFVSRGEVEDRFTRTNFNFQAAKTISDMPSRPRNAKRPSR
jgi:hypothetical protein